MFQPTLDPLKRFGANLRHRNTPLILMAVLATLPMHPMKKGFSSEKSRAADIVLIMADEK